MTKSLEKYPIFFIHLTCSTTIYDKCLDPAKSMIEFEVSFILLIFILTENFKHKLNLFISGLVQNYRSFICTSITISVASWVFNT